MDIKNILGNDILSVNIAILITNYFIILNISRNLSSILMFSPAHTLMYFWNNPISLSKFVGVGGTLNLDCLIFLVKLETLPLNPYWTLSGYLRVSIDCWHFSIVPRDSIQFRFFFYFSLDLFGEKIHFFLCCSSSILFVVHNSIYYASVITSLIYLI